jgi:ribonuclease T1
VTSRATAGAAASILFVWLALGSTALEPLRAWAGEETSGRSLVVPEIAVGELPPEARETIRLIRRGGPFPHERDGAVFGNFEKRLPLKEHGYYRSYTVRTPGTKTRGARRIIAGRRGELYYTDDHYRSFRRIRDLPGDGDRKSSMEAVPVSGERQAESRGP